ncbi:DegT/DnrJ/EryC1/StrS family aminotransferase [Enterococcus xiangfangensis]|uniref:DegT/DnrJ/EryC1/StrS family aminotransferase n=1 Tax=Enterococcus xiangfangensis TaxID=1296537 RepID=A0ABU3FA76_9ENTE|nr:DegT/DnrJ/EryC1/StrS family aminotransferase [Enterococcus xiangfangensis]MDT2759587.1 DegT/DnrJ/EryC1/StrS family aminotransferase [Enterococcus xiangfangensis]
MKKNKILLSSPHMSDEGYEQEFIKEAFDTNWIAPLGANVDGFEKELAEHVEIGNAAALVSGTSAIHLALKAVGVGVGDKVICQSLTFAASVNPIIYEGAVPIFVDSDLESWNMDPKLLEAALTKHPDVKAVIAVHLYGLSAELDEIKAICDRFNVPLIEDAAESLGTLYKGKQTGTIGKVGVFSFNGNKIITTSGGGMLISDDAELVSKVRFWSTQSREKERHYEHKEIGYNYRMSNIVAGIGRGQLKVLDERVAQKRAIYAYYKKMLADLPGIHFMPENTWNEPNCWLSVVYFDGIDPTILMDALANENIESRPVWKPMHLQPVFKKYDVFGGEVSEMLFAKGICLPSDSKMTIEDLERTTSIIKRAVNDEA